MKDFNYTYFLVAFFLIGTLSEMVLIKAKVVNGKFSYADSATSVVMGVGSLLVAGTYGFLIAKVSLFLFANRLFDHNPSSVVTFVLAFLLSDFVYYWMHRLNHEVRIWWASHVNHHSSRNFNFSTALRQNWTGDVTGRWIFYLPLPIFGFQPEVLAFNGVITQVHQFLIHTEAVRKLHPWVEYVFNTPSHHRVHHGSHPPYLDCNYGGTFIFWDRMFGTFVAEREDVPVRYGLTKNLTRTNLPYVLFHEWGALARDLVRATSFKEVLGLLFGRPGWRAANANESDGLLPAGAAVSVPPVAERRDDQV